MTGSSIYTRTQMLLGEEAIGKLKSSHVAVFGLGGVGSYTAEALARSGIGELTLVDDDVIAETNLNRQLYALHSTMGMKKTEVARARILDINPICQVNIISKFYLPENGDEFFTGSYNYIADAIDTVSAKIDLVIQAQKRNIPIISCMGTGNKFDPSSFKIADIYQTTVCPLCRVMRRELRCRGVEKLKVVYSAEEPVTPEQSNEKTTRRQTPGSLPFVPPVAGMIMAGEIVISLTEQTQGTGFPIQAT